MNTRTIRSIRSIISKNKLELFIANWSYSYDLKIDFATYQIMRANSPSWDGTSHQLIEKGGEIPIMG